MPSLSEFFRRLSAVFRPGDAWDTAAEPFAVALQTFFLSELIEERVNRLDNEAQKNQLRGEKEKKYAERLRERIQLRARGFKNSAARKSLSALADDFDALSLTGRMESADFNSPASFGRLLARVRAAGRLDGSLPLIPVHAREVGAALLCAVQDFALDFMGDEYTPSPKAAAVPGPTKAITVPDSTKAVIQSLLEKVDDCASKLRLRMVDERAEDPQSPPAPKTLLRAVAEFRVAVARSEGRVWLPLRPIPTAPLEGEELRKHYVGRPDEEAQSLARQIRHSDGAFLVSGYRGVGKSSFVNRVIWHALRAQEPGPAAPTDDWHIIPVQLNLAKVSGVQNILRLTLRAVRNTLMRDDGTKRYPFLDEKREVKSLQEAYVRATWKVTMSRSEATERKWEAGGSLGFNPGALFGAISGLESVKVLLGRSRARMQKVNRELSLLDYDENAAEEDLSRLIKSLAVPRPADGANGRKVRVKLVFVFDELDKMDTEKGLKPMIEGLKNLFLQQHAVFFLITSKKFYYDVLSDRSKEDALYTSYFSSLQHIPLLNYAQARAIVEDWVDWQGFEAAESQMLERLTHFLVYRSLGNPRDLIRELRRMQEWDDKSPRPYPRPYLTGGFGERAGPDEVKIFSAVQEEIEFAAGAHENERGGEAARLEQVRRGLYILTEELIIHQTLSLKSEQFEQLRKDNLSLLSAEDAQQVAVTLGKRLSNLHTSPGGEAPDQKPPVADQPLFTFSAGDMVLVAEPYFYKLTGRQPTRAQQSESSAPLAPAELTGQALIDEAESLSEVPAQQFDALSKAQRIEPDKLTPKLKGFLLRVLKDSADVGHRLAAAETVTPDLLFSTPDLDLKDLLLREANEKVRTTLIQKLSKADGEARALATDALLGVLNPDEPRKPAGDSEAAALKAIQTVADRDITKELLDWLCAAQPSLEVENAAMTAMTLIAGRYGVDLADLVISVERYLSYFTDDANRASLQANLLAFAPTLAPALKQAALSTREGYLRVLILERPLNYVGKLLAAPERVNATPLLSHLWDAMLKEQDTDPGPPVIDALAKEERDFVVKRVTDAALLLPGLQSRLVTSLQERLKSLPAEQYTPEQVSRAEARVKQVQAATPAKPTVTFPWQPAAKDPSTFSDFYAGVKLPGLDVPRRVSLPSPRFTWRRALALVLSPVPFLFTVFYFKAGLPADATAGQAFLTRAYTFLCDLLLVFPVYMLYLDTAASFGRTTGYSEGFKVRPFEGGLHIAGLKLNVKQPALIGLTILGSSIHTQLNGSLPWAYNLLILAANVISGALLVVGLRPLFDVDYD